MKKLIGVVGLGLGYLLGTRAGRERYDQIMRGFRRVRQDPRVQQQVNHVADVAKEQGPVVKDKVADAASSAVRKVRPSSPTPPGSPEGPEFFEDSVLASEDRFPNSVA
jgi:hypothetical protein